MVEYTTYQKQRLTVTPGITGFWQVSGRSELSFEEMVELDLQYIEERSVLVGIGCLLVYMGRVGLKRFLFQAYTQEKNVSQLLIVTTNDLLVKTIQQYRKTKYSRYTISGCAVIDNDLENY